MCGGVEECKYEGKKDDFLKHIVEKHEKKIVQMFDFQITKDSQEETKTNVDGQIKGNVNFNFDRVGIMKNDKGREAKLGENGKYFCGGILGTNCMCCNGYCGPSNGCNCSSCMKLDI